MNPIATILIVIALLALAGVVAYYIIDYLNYKKQNASDMTTVNNALNQEGQDRLGNLAYVVNQVNTVNDDIYNTITSNIQYTNSNVSVQAQNTNSLISNLNSIFNLTSADGKNTYSLLNLPGSATPNLNLINKVTATMGITANNLTPANSAQFCNASGSCIQFPDSSGNTYLTNLTNGGQVVLDGPVRVNSNMAIGTGASAPNMGVDTNNSLILNAKRVGLGSTAPVATLDVLQGLNGDDMLHLTKSGATSPAILVDSEGNIKVNQSIQLIPPTTSSSSSSTAITLMPTKPTSPPTSGITINPSTDGNSLEINTPAGGGLTINGNLSVSGNIKTHGTITSDNNVIINNPGILTVGGLSGTINGKAIQTAQ